MGAGLSPTSACKKKKALQEMEDTEQVMEATALMSPGAECSYISSKWEQLKDPSWLSIVKTEIFLKSMQKACKGQQY